MRIGVDACCWSNKRGFGRFTRELLRAVTALDRTNEYIFFADGETASDNEFPEGVRMVVAETSVAPTKAASASGRRSLRDMWALSRLVMKEDLDILFFPAVYSYFPVHTGAKIIVTIHDIIADLYPELVFPDRKSTAFWKIKQYLANRQAELILTVSEYSRQQIIKTLKIPESRVRAITEGPNKGFTRLAGDKEEMGRLLARYKLKDGQRFLLYVGGISPHKNLKTLVEAYRLLIRDPDHSGVALVLVGDYEGDSFYSSYNDLTQQIERLGLEGSVIFAGFVEDRDLVYLYNAAAMLVFPSLQEGFGLPAVEAMACGTPVAASNAGSLPEILGSAGSFFDPESPEGMRDTIHKLLTDDGLRESMGRRGLARAKEFTWERAARQTISIFDELFRT